MSNTEANSPVDLDCGGVATAARAAACRLAHIVPTHDQRPLVTARRAQWIVFHLHEVAMVVLPMLRPLRLLRLVTLLWVLPRSIGTALRGRVVTYAAGATLVLILIASLAILDAERPDPDSVITTFHDALWWATAAFATVAYSDYAPVTPRGDSSLRP